MPRTARAAQGGFFYHVLTRGNGRQVVLHDGDDYAYFQAVMWAAPEAIPHQRAHLAGALQGKQSADHFTDQAEGER